MSFIANLIKRMIPKTLLVRFMLIIIVPAIIGQLIAVYIFYQRHWYNVTEHTSGFIVNEIISLIKDVDYKLSPDKIESYLNLNYKFTPDTKIPNLPVRNSEELEILAHSLEYKISNNKAIFLNENGKIEIYLQIGSDQLKIILPAKILINPTTYIFVLWILFLTITLIAISLIFSKNQIKSILALTSAAENYGRGENIDNYKPTGAKEIRKAGLAFLKMKDRIEKQSAKRTQMLAMISHDLKTPLTRMKLQVELMNDSEEKEELKYDIDSMQQMIASYLDFARGEGGEEFIQIEINSWLTDYIKNKWNGCNIEVKKEKKKIFARIKPHSFERALANLIGNSIKYSTKQKISVYSSRDNVIISIEDNGTGINDEDKKNVFRPFYRIDKSRSLDSSSSVGLGLAITKEIINGHYGNIILMDSKDLGGLLVKITVPKILK